MVAKPPIPVSHNYQCFPSRIEMQLVNNILWSLICLLTFWWCSSTVLKDQMKACSHIQWLFYTSNVFSLLSVYPALIQMLYFHAPRQFWGKSVVNSRLIFLTHNELLAMELQSICWSHLGASSSSSQKPFSCGWWFHYVWKISSSPSSVPDGLFAHNFSSSVAKHSCSTATIFYSTGNSDLDIS